MKNTANLRFFLALGNQKIVVVKKEDNLHIYADKNSTRKNVSIERLAALIQSK